MTTGLETVLAVVIGCFITAGLAASSLAFMKMRSELKSIGSFVVLQTEKNLVKENQITDMKCEMKELNAEIKSEISGLHVEIDDVKERVNGTEISIKLLVKAHKKNHAEDLT